MTNITTRDDQPVQSQTRIEIYTDGSCIGNPSRFAGYGAVLLRLDAADNIINRREISGRADGETTNIRMEMTAVCVALEAINPNSAEPITVLSDADIISKAMNGWLAKWKLAGWRKANGKPVENRDLWERLDKAVSGRSVTFKWVRGHNGTEHNERADALAHRQARKAERLAA
ncbi:ribonuclease H family protein [Ketogulonicigenium robustum]|nr:ribonuclease H [Ketogulonicigenium robustum]